MVSGLSEQIEMMRVRNVDKRKNSGGRFLMTADGKVEVGFIR